MGRFSRVDRDPLSTAADSDKVSRSPVLGRQVAAGNRLLSPTFVRGQWLDTMQARIGGMDPDRGG